jgi:hypothetical protein
MLTRKVLTFRTRHGAATMCTPIHTAIRPTRPRTRLGQVLGLLHHTAGFARSHDRRSHPHEEPTTSVCGRNRSIHSTFPLPSTTASPARRKSSFPLPDQRDIIGTRERLLYTRDLTARHDTTRTRLLTLGWGNRFALASRCLVLMYKVAICHPST